MIVEATIVFPLVFLILFFLIFLGKAFYQKGKIDSLVTRFAIARAADVADPLLSQINGSVPNTNSDVQPYRYIFSNTGSLESSTETDLKSMIAEDNMIFSLKARDIKTEADFENHILYSTFWVEASYTFKFPITLLGMELDLIKFSSRAEVPVTDVPEFIRNTDMVLDYIERSETAQEGIKNVKEAMSKAKSFLSGLGSKGGD